MITSLVKEANFGYTVPARLQAPPAAVSQLHGVDGLVLTPVGERGRGPPRHGAHAEVVATAGKPLVQRWSPPLVQRWSPPLASRSELAFNATLLVQSSPFL